MNEPLNESSLVFDSGADAVLILDPTGRHQTPTFDVPDNITFLFLPSKSPEMNLAENSCGATSAWIGVQKAVGTLIYTAIVCLTGLAD